MQLQILPGRACEDVMAAVDEARKRKEEELTAIVIRRCRCGVEFTKDGDSMLCLSPNWNQSRSFGILCKSWNAMNRNESMLLIPEDQVDRLR
ncbi:unnamed protein product, partial [Mesorhabditis belari]|uniref:Uncharacterized protein n=1 Tax=Mesorhabditis belari TaxID=2138241 RepID=A0AAF3FQ32_9BILA